MKVKVCAGMDDSDDFPQIAEIDVRDDNEAARVAHEIVKENVGFPVDIERTIFVKDGHPHLEMQNLKGNYIFVWWSPLKAPTAGHIIKPVGD